MKNLIVFLFIVTGFISGCTEKEPLRVTFTGGSTPFVKEGDTWYDLTEATKRPFAEEINGDISLISEGNLSPYHVSVRNNVLSEENGSREVMEYRNGEIHGLENNGLLGLVKENKLYFEGEESATFNRNPAPEEALFVFYILFFNEEALGYD